MHYSTPGLGSDVTKKSWDASLCHCQKDGCGVAAAVG